LPPKASHLGVERLPIEEVRAIEHNNESAMKPISLYEDACSIKDESTLEAQKRYIPSEAHKASAIGSLDKVADHPGNRILNNLVAFSVGMVISLLICLVVISSGPKMLSLGSPEVPSVEELGQYLEN